MSDGFCTISNYEATDHRPPMFRRRPSRPDEILTIAHPDYIISADNAPPVLPAAYRHNGCHYINDCKDQWIGVPYSLPDELSEGENHTAWVRLIGDRVQVFLGSRMISFDVQAHTRKD